MWKHWVQNILRNQKSLKKKNERTDEKKYV